jgi:transposase
MMTFEELLSEYEKLSAANAQLQEKVADYEHKVSDYEQRLSEARRLIAQLRRQVFGSKAERLTSIQQEQLQQLTLDLELQALRPGPVLEHILEEDRPAKERSRRRRVRHPLPEQIETETITLEPEIRECGSCGRMPERISEEISEVIDLIPARMIRRRTVRPKYACSCGGAGVAIAPLPARLIAQSHLGLGLAVHILLSRFDDHLSYYWLEKQFAERHGVVIARQQMVQWVEQIAVWLKPIYEAMWQRMHAGGYLQIDETPVKVLDPEVKGKAAQGYLWFYAVPGGDVSLVFDRSRGLAPVRERLKDFIGTIQTDAYEVYQSLNRNQPALNRIGCLAHARRRFYTALLENSTDAVWFISAISFLYEIEQQARNLSPDERKALRLQQAPEVWQGLKTRAETLKPTVLPQSSLGKAISYFLNEYEALTGYLQNGSFEIDNNLVENAIRPTAVGRKRWLFIGHPEAGWRSAVIYSMLTSCRRRGINPRDYLTDVLARLPQININQIDSLLPGNWKPHPSV